MDLNLGTIEARAGAPRTHWYRVRLSSVPGGSSHHPLRGANSRQSLEYAFDLPLNVTHIHAWQPMLFSMLGGEVFLTLLLGHFLLNMALRFKSGCADWCCLSAAP